MSTQKKQDQKGSARKTANLQQGKSDLYAFLDGVCTKHLHWLIWVVLAFGLLFSFLLFDSRISLSGDDSAYIMRAHDFIHHFTYPSFQGPMYPFILAPVVLIFGVSLVPLKLISMISILAFLYLFYLVFRHRISNFLLLGILFLLSINSYLLYYASQTYSEAFYLFVEIIVLFVFFKKFIANEESVSMKQDLKRHALLASVLLVLALTRSVGFSAIFAVAGYFLFTRQWKNLLYSIAAFSLFFIVFQGVKYMLWSDGGLQFSSQGTGLLQKDYYNPQAGNEDIAGLFKRLIENTNLYLSKHFMYFTGLRKFDIMMSVKPLYSILIVLLSLTSIVYSFRKNKYVFFTGLFTGAFLFVTFVVLQSKWDQSRLVIPALPFLILLVLYALYSATTLNKARILQFTLPLVLFIMFLQTFGATVVAVKESSSNSGKYGGFTPDWKNYMKASEWVADNLTKADKVACRKPSISFIYGKGHDFYGIMQLPNYSTDAFLNFWEKNNTSIMVFEYNALVKKPLTPDFVSLLKKNLLALLFSGDTVYMATYSNDTVSKQIVAGSQAINLGYVGTVEEYKSKIYNKDLVNRIYYPDSLLNQLKNNNVTHILTANLRRNSTKKDGMIINTVERYQAFIQEKYPQMFTKVVQVGDDENEPAVISKIDYSMQGK